jgi:hypothetical protein
MNKQRFLLEFCLNGEFDVHQLDVKTYNRYFYCRTQKRADALGKKIKLTQELEFYSYINAGLDKIEKLRNLRRKFGGLQ